MLCSSSKSLISLWREKQRTMRGISFKKMLVCGPTPFHVFQQNNAGTFLHNCQHQTCINHNQKTSEGLQSLNRTDNSSLTGRTFVMTNISHKD